MSRLRRLTLDPGVARADDLVEQARDAIAAGRKTDGRRALWAALQADPNSTRAWLMLAALASPQASLNYATRALAIRPDSPVALAAVEWARHRVAEEAQGAELRAEGPSLEAQAPGLTADESTAAALTLMRGQAPAAEAPASRPPSAEVTVADVRPPEAAAPQADVTLVRHEPRASEAPAAPAPSADATIAEVLPPEAAAPLAGVTLVHAEAPAAETSPAEETLADTGPHRAVAPPGGVTLVHAEAPAAESSPADETLADTGPHRAVAPAAKDVRAPGEAPVESSEPGASPDKPASTPPPSPAPSEEPDPSTATTFRSLPAARPELEDDSPTSPIKPVRPDGPAGRASLTLLVLAAILTGGLLAAFGFRGRLAGQPERPAAAAVAALEDYQKATEPARPTDTPTVTPSPTITPTFTATPSITPTPTASQTPPPFQPGAGGGEARWIDVNLSRQMLTAMEGDTPVRSFLVSTGLWNTPTVTGQFRVYVQYVAADMSGPGYYLPQVPYVMYFHRDYGIHGTYWHNNFGNPMSHGCVNMRTDEAGWLFEWASVGTLVNVHY